VAHHNAFNSLQGPALMRMRLPLLSTGRAQISEIAAHSEVFHLIVGHHNRLTMETHDVDNPGNLECAYALG